MKAIIVGFPPSSFALANRLGLTHKDCVFVHGRYSQHKVLGLKGMKCYVTHDASLLELDNTLTNVLEGWKVLGIITEYEKDE